MLATYPLSKKITNQFHEAVFSFTVRGIAMNLTLVFKGTCVGITGLPPEESETATPFVGYRFFPSRVSDISGRYHRIWIMEVCSRDKITR